MNILFVSWDGPQVSYLEGLFLPIFGCLAAEGWKFHVVQFTWSSPERLQKTRDACEVMNIPYRSIGVWRRPVSLGSLLTALYGIKFIRKAIRDWQIDVVMPRSTLPALSCMWALKSTALPMLFDADGLPLDERVDFAGLSSNGMVYRFLRDVEAQAVRQSESVLTRTRAAADILLARAGPGTPVERFHVVGNGRDTQRFTLIESGVRSEVRAELGVREDSPLILYVGSLGDQYCLEEMISVFHDIFQRRSDAYFLILTESVEIACSAVAKHSEVAHRIVVRSASPADVPMYISSADLGLAFRRPTFSMQGVAPVKLGEYLLCGVPVLATAGVGDTSGISPDVGLLLHEFGFETRQAAAVWFTDQVLPSRERFRSRCREIGIKHHSLESTVNLYSHALQGLRR
ncbi:hypothetical protein T5B8_17161 [Salinisphaera sp. T5B8]|uniref:glycosyltransferase family 4 protein n=1 Tax=Salinisphaera sp. T5B8 TaxID=1304154 RepID=UPI00333EC866